MYSLRGLQKAECRIGKCVEELKIKLSDVVKDYEVKEQEFEYAGTKGIAELLGWQIVFFHKMDDLVHTAAVNFSIKNSFYEDMIRYSYIISADLFIVFGIEDNILTSLEIITDENMIRFISFGNRKEHGENNGLVMA